MKDYSMTGVPHSVLRDQGVDVHEFETALNKDIRILMEEAIHSLATLLPWSGLDLRRVCVGHSGGKDSVLVRHIANAALRRAKPDTMDLLTCFHTPKSADAQHNPVSLEDLQYLYQLAVLSGQPIHISTGRPTDAGFVAQIDGTRRAEASRSNGRSTNIVVNGRSVGRDEVPKPFAYTVKGLFDMAFFYPIYEWTDAEVWAAIHYYNLPYSKSYWPHAYSPEA